jgi:predicted TIM-barrel fold metal-dependent hydrolase
MNSDHDLDAPLVVVTTDTHVGPRLKDDLRDYCPKQYLGEFDAFVRVHAPVIDDPLEYFRVWSLNPSLDEQAVAKSPKLSAIMEGLRTNATPGHHDVHARLDDMDRDGVAAEVVYHGSQNGQPFPFIHQIGGTFNALYFAPTGDPRELELAAVGQHMYNQWLADQCSVQAERHVGLAHLPMWDIDAATAELRWAHSVGLRGVNFPAPKPGIKPYDDLAWDPFWSACEELGMVLATHDGAGFDDLSVSRPHTHIALSLEGDLPRKLFPRMIFGGMFERYPGLKLVLTELESPASAWWSQMGKRFDEIWEVNRETLTHQLPRPPSEYMTSSVFLGQSYLHVVPAEVATAVSAGYASNFMWGSDYPHHEGCYRHAEDDVVETTTRLGLRSAFWHAPAHVARAMVGETAARVFGLDLHVLSAVAERAKALTPRRLGQRPEAVPDHWPFLARALHPYPEFHEDFDERALARSPD